MRRVLVFLLVWGGCASQTGPATSVVQKTPQPRSSKVRVVEDRFTGVDTIEMTDHRFSAGSSSFKLALFCGEPGGLLALSTIQDTWRYLRCHDVSLLVDGKPFAHDGDEHDGSVGRGYVHEYIRVRLNSAQLRELVSAQSIEIRICGDEGVFGDAIMRDLREVARRLEPPSGSTQDGGS